MISQFKKTALGVMGVLATTLLAGNPASAFEDTVGFIADETIGSCELVASRDPDKKRAFIAVYRQENGRDISAMHLAQNPREITIESEEDQLLFTAVGIAEDITPDFLERECGLSNVSDFYLLPHSYPTENWRGDEDYVEGLPYAEQGAMLLSFVAPDPSSGLRHRYVYGFVGKDDTWTARERQQLEYANDTPMIRQLRGALRDYTTSRLFPDSFERGARVVHTLKILANPMRRYTYDNGTIVEYEENVSRNIIGNTNKTSTWSITGDDSLVHGIIAFADGYGYSGHLDPDNLSRQNWGQLFDPSGERIHMGGYLDNERHGDGIIVFTDGSECRGEFDRGQLSRGRFTDANGRPNGFCRQNSDGRYERFR